MFGVCLCVQGVMQDVEILVMPQGYISQCPDLNRSECSLLLNTHFIGCFIEFKFPLAFILLGTWLYWFAFLFTFLKDSVHTGVKQLSNWETIFPSIKLWLIKCFANSLSISKTESCGSFECIFLIFFTINYTKCNLTWIYIAKVTGQSKWMLKFVCIKKSLYEQPIPHIKKPKKT